MRPLYFPVKPEPLRMQAGLARFGSDFGNGSADQCFFPRDETSAAHVAEKARLVGLYPAQNAGCAGTELERAASQAAQAWMLQTLGLESGLGIEQLGTLLAEDFVVLYRPERGFSLATHETEAASDRAVWVHVYFPSGWRPERIVGKSFREIHAAVPAFEQVERASANLTESMVARGPYVRFVWTISADAVLDHHPEHAGRAPWTPETPRGFLRVERQVTVPLPEARASLFLIRTYLYGFDELSSEQRSVLGRALELMPPEILRYKGLEAALPRALQLLGA